MKTGAWIGIIIGAVILSLIVGSQLFPKTKVVEVSPQGKFCYDNEMVSQEDYNYYKNLAGTLLNEMKCFRDVASSSVQDLAQLKLNYCFKIMSQTEQTRCNQKVIAYFNEESSDFNYCQAKF